MNVCNQQDGHIPERPALDAWLGLGHTEAAGSLSIRTAGSLASQAAVGAESSSCRVANAEGTESTRVGAAGAVAWEPAAELGTVASIGVESNCMMASVYRPGPAVGASVAGNHCCLGSHGPSPPCSDDEEGAVRGC